MEINLREWQEEIKRGLIYTRNQQGEYGDDINDYEWRERLVAERELEETIYRQYGHFI